jgi:multicomponent Na+:H+ antiporter subunit F
VDRVLDIVVLMLLASLAAGLYRVVRGPGTGDRMSGVLLFGSTAVGLVLVSAELLDRPAIADVALVLVVLAAMLAIVLVQAAEREQRRGAKGR